MSIDKTLARKFRNIYSADLLPVSFPSIKICDLIEWDGLLKRTISLQNWNLLYNIKMLETKRQQLLNALEAIPVQKANFSQASIDSSFEIGAGIDIPNIAASISTQLGFGNIHSFTIDDVSCKIFADKLKFEIREIIRSAKNSDRAQYRKNLKGLYFIDKLYYAKSVTLETKLTDKIALEAAITKTKLLNPKLSFSSAGTASITYQTDATMPFAADIESVKDFID